MRRIAVLVALAGCSSARAERAPSAAADGAPVLVRYCARCHTGARAQADFDFVDDPARLVADGLIVPGDAKQSLVYRRMAAGEMPPDSVKARPSSAELARVKKWIDTMPKAAPVRSDADVARVLAADLASLPRAARTHARWVTLTHLANAGVPAAQLERYRSAVAILLASLTWAPAPPVPVAVDRERTIFRIDLRELGWSAATWDLIRASYPYGVARGGDVPDAVRADWLVATASRPPLYHAILGIPDSEVGLAQLLGVDLRADVIAGRVVRAGFTNSGVSINNRVIERHATRFGALWRSYDFASSVGRENVFAHPLDFVAAGGEIIFNLPDGMQAYMLVDANGKRIDKAPTTIVSDPRRPDRAVENALSCIGCHGAGIIDKTDQVRAATAADDPDRARVEALYPTAARATPLFAADRKRFAAALATLGAKPVADPAAEPITLLAARYEAELDRRHAAAELGIAPDDLRVRLERSTALRQALGALTVDGGTIKRDSWAALFPRAVRELGVGVPFTPAASGDRAPAVFVDRDRHTWVVVASAGFEQRAAIAACRAQGFALPRQDELVRALGQGLAVGLAGAPRTAWTFGTRLDATNQRYGAIVITGSATSRRASIDDRHGVICLQR